MRCSGRRRAGTSASGSRHPTSAGLVSDSTVVLRTVVESLRAEGWQIVNVDATIVAQQPRIGPHIPNMRQQLGDVLGLPVDAVSVKATTTDHLGALGRAEGIAAQAVALLIRERASGG